MIIKKINDLEYEPTISLRSGQLVASFGESTEEIVFSKTETRMIEEIFKPENPNQELDEVLEALLEMVIDCDQSGRLPEKHARKILAKHARKILAKYPGWKL